MKRNVSLKIAVRLLLVSMLCITAASCSDEGGKPSADGSEPAKGNDSTVQEETEAPLPYAFAQEELDYGGYNFRVLTDHIEEVDILKDELVVGEIVSESVYNRNMRVEELLNIEISAIEVENWEDVSPTVQKYVMAGDDAFDALNAGLIEVFRASSNGHLLPLHEIETLDTEAEWWDSSILEAFDFGNGNVYMIAGGIGYWDDYGLSCMAINIDLMRRNDMEVPYDAVRAGEWDYEMFHGYIKGFEQDLNGDGEWDPYDQYGCVDNLDFGSRVGCGFGMFAVDKNESGRPEFRLTEAYYDRFFALIDQLCNDPALVIMERKFGYDEGGPIFGYGNTLFKPVMVNSLQDELRKYDFMSTIVPMPKYDENQENYLNSARDIYCTAYGVPITNSDTDRTGYIMDAMSYFGELIIRPAAIEKQCLVKGVQDMDTVDMINIIFDSKAYDLTYITGWGSWYSTLWDFVDSGRNNLASREAQFAKRVNKDIENSLKTFGIE